MNTRKYCIVPLCLNSNVKTPDKLFFYVPNNPKIRKKWMTAVKRVENTVSPKSTVYCCEDHFDLEEDMDNFIKYKLVGGKLKLKKGVLPHKFDCQKTPKKKIERTAFKKRRDIEYFERVLSKDIGHEDLQKHPIEFIKCENEDSNVIKNTDLMNMKEEIDEVCELEDTNIIDNTAPIDINVEIDEVSKNNEKSQKTRSVQVNMKPKMKTKSTNTPVKWKQRIVNKEYMCKCVRPSPPSPPSPVPSLHVKIEVDTD